MQSVIFLKKYCVGLHASLNLLHGSANNIPVIHDFLPPIDKLYKRVFGFFFTIFEIKNAWRHG